MDVEFCLEALEEDLRHGRPEILNTDQGSQFTSQEFTERLQRDSIAISMDGTRAMWEMRNSRFAKRPDYETRVTTGADGYFDVKGEDPRTAIIKEMLQTPMGFTEAPEFPTEMLRIGDEYSKTSQKPE